MHCFGNEKNSLTSRHFIFFEDKELDFGADCTFSVHRLSHPLVSFPHFITFTSCQSCVPRRLHHPRRLPAPSPPCLCLLLPPTHANPHPPLCCAAFSPQHLSLIWNEEEMPPRGLTSGPSWGLAEIDACDPAVLIYFPHPQGSGRLHCALLERTAGRQTKQGGERGRSRRRKREGETDVMW